MNILEILQSVPEGPQHDFQNVGRYNDPAELSVCIHCGGAPDAPQHVAWRKRIVQAALKVTAREASFNPSLPDAGPTMGLFQSYQVGMDVGREGDEVVIFGPIKDSLKNFRPIGWGVGLTVHIRGDGSGEIYMEDDDE